MPCEDLYNDWSGDYKSYGDALKDFKSASDDFIDAVKDGNEHCVDLKTSFACGIDLYQAWDALDRMEEISEAVAEARDQMEASADSLWDCINDHKSFDEEEDEIEIELESIEIRIGAEPDEAEIPEETEEE